MAETKVPRGEVTVDITLPSDLPMIDGDEHQLCQVFTNLLANAFEALNGAGHIGIAGATTVIGEDPEIAGPHQPARMIVVDVTDDGPGRSGGTDR